MAAASMWSRPPRLILAVFALVAVVSVLALGWLAWLLLEQDAALEARRQQVLLEETADRAVVATRDALARLESALAEGDRPSARLPAGVLRMMVAPDGIAGPDCPALLYQPVARIRRVLASAPRIQRPPPGDPGLAVAMDSGFQGHHPGQGARRRGAR